MNELADRTVDHLRLVRDLLEVDALRYRRHELRGRLADVLAKFENVGALGHHDADAKRGLALLPHHEIGRILITAGDGGDIAEPEHPAAAFDRGLGHRLGAIERAGDP